ncbi:Pyridoxamine 5'-phosphate oxidase-related, FMN-binding [Oceanicola granulosus HTCC2516]|uniref:Pyridoxamine 5'-phosphate oxidase-related, FMN-binding n=1 Tax=Oceanicola granulosus (strain ATCC BAA-861 / DSM 15982 / KCTC 12143 / HTCC2516) TaxID=314256 RepID=Q2CK66_OCEGH|nr:pyridoxamine 5'-phosphate oxidase family protein [Oceanicola granulosus]EAR52923.1 Pyridoxamine 5'-phosphate oxidase-related, FMN-binding [Oceanicola granulosus HTCC2516]
MSDAPTLADFHGRAWASLEAARGALIAFATVEGTVPQVRSLVLRRASAAEALCEVHTDAGSAKVANLAINPRAALLLWDEAAQVQVRLGVEVETLRGAEVRALWERVPEASRSAYGKDPAPGTPIADALAYRLATGLDNFAVLRCHAQTLDVVHLGDDHRRARFERADGWAGQWLSP